MSPTAVVAPTSADAAAANDMILPAKPVKPLWQGFFMQFNVGYGTTGGEAGPLIPDLKNLSVNGGFKAWKQQGCAFGNQGCYGRAVTTDRGEGLAAAFQIGYNIMGYASLWLDLSWKGSFGSKAEMAGTGAGAVMAGFHPLRYWRSDTPFDLRLYGGYGFFEILYYYETEFISNQAEGKSWTGTSIPFGLSGEWRIPDSVFAIGVDLRFVRGSYTRWIYNNDKDIASDFPDDPVTTMRFEPRVVFGWHF